MKAREAGIHDEMSYGDLMDDHSSAWCMVDALDDPKTDNKYWIHTLKIVFDELTVLGLSKPTPQLETKKRGSSRKHPIDEKPKRPCDRPQKTCDQMPYIVLQFENCYLIISPMLCTYLIAII